MITLIVATDMQHHGVCDKYQREVIRAIKHKELHPWELSDGSTCDPLTLRELNNGVF